MLCSYCQKIIDTEKCNPITFDSGRINFCSLECVDHFLVVHKMRELKNRKGRFFMETITELVWTSRRPTVEGFYIFKKIHEWPLVLGEVKRGRWQNSQNPDELYFSPSDQYVSTHDGYWYGPIPEAPKI